MASSVVVNSGTILVNGLNVFYRSVGDSITNNGHVLLLHGMRFSSANWQEINTLANLASWNYYAVAIDLPGFGNSKDCKEKPSNTAQFINDLCISLKLKKTILVSPSMSGEYSLPFLHEYGANMTAYIPIAPVQTQKYSKELYNKIKVPTFIVYGENDEILGKQSLKNLLNIPDNKVFKMENAGHACYLDKPDNWHKILKSALQSLQ